MSDYRFKGHDWTELCDCWGIKVEPDPLMLRFQDTEGLDEERLKELAEEFPETITKQVPVGNQLLTIDTSDEEEVLEHKLTRHIHSNLSPGDGFIDKQMRVDLENFLTALIHESEKLDYSSPVYKGMLAVEDDFTFASWIIQNIRSLWT